MNFSSASCFGKWTNSQGKVFFFCSPMPAPFFLTTDENVSCVFMMPKPSTRHVCQFLGGHHPLSKVVLSHWPIIWTMQGLHNVRIIVSSKQGFVWEQMPLFHECQSGQRSLSPCCCMAICLLAHNRFVGIYTIVMMCLYLAKIQSVHAPYFHLVAVRMVVNHAPTARLFTGFFSAVDVEIQERQKFRRRWKLEEIKSP